LKTRTIGFDDRLISKLINDDFDNFTLTRGVHIGGIYIMGIFTLSAGDF